MVKRNRNLPFNQDAEKVVIGSLLVSKEALYKVFAALKEEDFYVGKRQLIYRAVLSLQAKAIIPDIYTTTEELLLKQQLENIGGVEYLKECSDTVVALVALDFYLNIVKDNSDLRKFLITRDLCIYADSFNGKLYHYQNYDSQEIDAAIELNDGEWCAFEIKLGANKIDEAANNLIKISNDIVASGGKSPKVKCVICGMINAAYLKKDGVYVLPITSLKN